MKVQSVKLKTSVLFHAPWNPRGEITLESVADLTASIKAQGLLQDIGVWRDETNAYFVIYGNRRFVACREAGMTEIPAKLYDCPLAVAQELTRIENEVRLGVDPLEDAKLLNSMRSLGFTQEELAAHFAVPLATVCRRLKLANLASCWREVMANGARITTDTLERVAAYPEDIQTEVFNEVNERWDFFDECDKPIRWNDIAWYVRDFVRELDDSDCFEKCRSCPKRTGAQPDLFGEIAEDTKLGKCLDKACFKATVEDYAAEKLDALIPPGIERVQVRNRYEFSGYRAEKERPDDENPCAYYYQEGGKLHLRFGPSAKQLSAAEKRQKEDRKAAAKVEAEMRKRHAEVYKKINAWYADGLEQAARDFVGKDGWRVLELYFTFAGYYGWSKPANVAAWAKKKTFDNWWTTCGKDLFYFAKVASVGARNTRQLLKTFKKVKWADVLGKDDLAFVKSDKFGVY